MARAIAPRFEIAVLKDKSVSDKAQVPATGAVINFYRAGATVSADITIPAFAEMIPVSIYDPGLLAINDFVRPGTGAGPGTLVVSSVAPTQLYITSNMSSDVFLGIGSRLVPTNNRPNVYKDPLCQTVQGTSLTVDSVTARASAYLASDRVDYDVSITGQPLRLYVDGAGVIGRSDQRWNDIRDFGASVQAAVDALPSDGGIVFVPRGTWTLSSGVIVNKPNVTIMGEQAGSILSPAVVNSFDLITVNQTNFQMRDVTLEGGAAAADPNGKCCLVIQGVGVSGNSVRGIALWTTTINNAPRYGLWLRDVEDFHARSCMIGWNRIAGVRIEKTSAPSTISRFVGGEIGQNYGRGFQAVGVSGVTLVGCTFEGNRVVAGENDGAGVDLESCGRADIRSCYFEDANNYTGTKTSQFVAIRSCPGAIVTECSFAGGADVAHRPLRAAKFIASPGSRMSNATSSGMTDYVAIFDTNSADCLELGNLDEDPNTLGWPRFRFDAKGSFSMSRLTLNAREHATDQTLPPAGAVLPGAMAWVDSYGGGGPRLVVWSGTAWKQVTIN